MAKKREESGQMRFVEITKDNWEAAIKLRPKRTQYRHLRGDVALHSLAKCYVMPGRYVPFLIEDDGRAVGCFRLRDYGRGVNLVAFFIDRQYQGRGLGRKAVRHFIAWVREHCPKAQEIEIWVGPENAAARSLYESLGFAYTGQVSATGNLYMELRLVGQRMA